MEYLTREDLVYKPDVIRREKFEYSPLGEAFKKGLGESDKKEGLFKRLKNIEGKTEQQLGLIEDRKKLQIIKNKHLADQVKDKRPKLKSLRHLIDKEDREQVRYLTEFIIWQRIKLIITSCTINHGIKIRMLLIFMNLEQWLIHFKYFISKY